MLWNKSQMFWLFAQAGFVKDGTSDLMFSGETE